MDDMQKLIERLAIAELSGVSLLNLGYLKEAIQWYKLNLIIAQGVGDRAAEGTLCKSLGIAYCKLEDFQRGVAYHEQCLKIARERRDRASEGDACQSLGTALSRLGDFQKAIEYHKQALQIAIEMGDRPLEGRAYLSLGCVVQSLGDLQQAVAYQNRCISISREIGDRALEGAAYGKLGCAVQSLGDSQQAVAYHNRCASISREIGDRALEGVAYGNLGNCYRVLGDVQQALACHKQSVSISQETGNRADEGVAYGCLGDDYKIMGDFKQAIEYYKQSLRITKELENRAAEGMIYCNLGIVHYSLGNYKQATEHHKQSLSIARRIGDKMGEGCAYANLGNAYQGLGDLENFKKGTEYQLKSAHLSTDMRDRAGEGRSYGSLGNALHTLGDFQEAVNYNKKSLEIAKEVKDKEAEGGAYRNLGIDYYSMRDSKKALECHMQYLSIAQELGDSAGEAYACYLLGLDFESLGTLIEALNYYRSSVILFDQTRALLQSEDTLKITFRELYRDAYTALWRALLKNEEPEEALVAAEQGRAQALMDILKVQYGVGSLTSTVIDAEGTISYVLNDLTTQIVFLALDRNTINFWVLSKGKDIRFKQGEVQRGSAQNHCISLLPVSTFKIIGDHAKQDPANLLIETAFKEIGARLCVKCEDRSLDVHELSDDPAFGRGDDAENSLHRLYDVIIDPIVEFLQGDELIVVPDGPLCMVPFAALSESTRIRTVPSLTTLKLIKDSPKEYHSKRGVLLVGDPCLEEVTTESGKPKFEQLQYAREEVEMIGKLLKTTPLTGRTATKDKVLKEIASVALVHIAAPGEEKTGEIALAPNPGRQSKNPKEEDFILKMSDVQAVRVQAGLVVLSCCHSGQGEIKSEGVVGMARAFLAAGARSVLVSLWAIDDEANLGIHENFLPAPSRREERQHGSPAGYEMSPRIRSVRCSQALGSICSHW